MIYFFFFFADLLSATRTDVSALRFWLLFCELEFVIEPDVGVPDAGALDPLPDFFFFSRRSFSSNSEFSRSIKVINVLQRRCNSRAVRDFKNQSKRNCGEFLWMQN